MFLGEHFPRLDDKGRLVLPAKFRGSLAAGLVLAKGQDFSIVVWPAAEFEAYAASLAVESQSSARARATERLLFAGAFDQQPDSQGTDHRAAGPTGVRRAGSRCRRRREEQDSRDLGHHRMAGIPRGAGTGICRRG